MSDFDVEFKAKHPDLPWERMPVLLTMQNLSLRYAFDLNGDVVEIANSLAKLLARYTQREIRWNFKGSQQGHYHSPKPVQADKLFDTAVIYIHFDRESGAYEWTQVAFDGGQTSHSFDTDNVVDDFRRATIVAAKRATVPLLGSQCDEFVALNADKYVWYEDPDLDGAEVILRKE